MSDLISRQSAIDTFMKATSDGDKADWCAYVLKQMPSVQPEPSQVARDIATIIENEKDMRVIAQPEIIRCKECINHGKEICYYWSHFYGTINTPDDGFCHKAERRTGEPDDIFD